MKLFSLFGCFLAIVLCSVLLAKAPVQAQQGVEPHGTGAYHSRENAEDKSLSTGKKKVDELGERVSSGIDDLGGRISSYVNGTISLHLGDWVYKELSFGITWLTILACVVLLCVVLVVERLLRVLNTSIMRKLGTKEEKVSLLELLLAAAARPLSLLVWTYGIYAALTPFFRLFRKPDGSNSLQGVVHLMTNFAVTIVPFWFVFRFIGLLDDSLSKRAAATAKKTDHILAVLMKSWRRPLRFLFFLIWARAAVAVLVDQENLLALLSYLFALTLIGGIAWLVIRTTDILEDLLLAHYRIDVQDNLQARKMHTQIRLLKRIIVITILVVATASMLMMFERVRQFGMSILASAGILGIVAGLAAQQSIANLLVGIQIAITQPIRVDDVVVVENEWGKIEEINSTYVVVRIWDLRRLILPITYFTEKPFQNWTRTSADLLGTVFLYVDYSIPLEEVRQELHRILKESKLWDGKVWKLQVTDAKERTIELRAMMSALNASFSWDLRCEVREKLIAYLQKNYPDSLPKLHVALERHEEEAG